jgi:acetyl esterase
MTMPPFRSPTPDAEAQWVLGLVAKANRPRLDSFSDPAAARAEFSASCKPLDLKPTEMAAVVDHRIKDATGNQKMLVRDYRPRGLPAGPAPALMYFHGGGFVVGSPDTHDNICRLLADLAQARVLSVDYRMGPEHRFPAAPDDCRAAWDWLAAEAKGLGVDGARIAVGGDSAGGNLAAVLSLDLRDAGGPQPCLQALIYPATDSTPDSPRDPATDEGFLLDRTVIDWFMRQYHAQPADARHWRASPAKAASHAGLPPAFLLTCGYDPIGVQGAAYGDLLRAAGVPIEHKHYPGALHGFFSMAGALKSARQGIEEMAAALRSAFARTG